MNTLKLDGLIGSHPLGALAGFGLLRVLHQSGIAARLWFEERDDWVARIDSSFETFEALSMHLKTWIASPREALLDWTGDDDVRVVESEYRRAVAASLDQGERLAFLAALAADGALDKSKGLIKPTAFYMASGQQSFCDTLREIIAHTRKAPDASFREALLGPWEYSTPIWCAGWDPGTERMHALRHRAPTKEKTSSVGGAVYLAFEALPLFPSFSVRRRDRTTGFVSRDRLRHWRWPVPAVPVGLETLTVLLASREVAGRKEEDSLRHGIGAIYEATRHEFGQGYGVFRPARRLG